MFSKYEEILDSPAEIESKSQILINKLKNSPYQYLRFIFYELLNNSNQNILINVSSLFQQTFFEKGVIDCWISNDPNLRIKIIDLLLKNLESEILVKRKVIARTLCSIAIIEKGSPIGNDLFVRLSECNQHDEENLSDGYLRTIIYIFEEIKSLEGCTADSFLISILSQLSMAKESSIALKLNALQNIFRFCSSDFSNSSLKKAIINEIFKFSKNKNEAIRYYSFKCLLEVIKKFCFKMYEMFFPILFETIMNLGEKDNFKLDIAAETLNLSLQCMFILPNEAKAQFNTLIPTCYPSISNTLLNILAQDFDESLNISKQIKINICSALTLINKITVQNYIYIVINFIEKNFLNQNLNFQEGALFAIISLIEIPNHLLLCNVLSKYFPWILKMAENGNAFRELGIWAIIQICEKPNAFLGDPKNLKLLISSFIEKFKDNNQNVVLLSLSGLRNISNTYNKVNEINENFFLLYVKEVILVIYDYICTNYRYQEEAKLNIMNESFILIETIIRNCIHLTVEVRNYFHTLLEDSLIRLSNWAQNPQQINLEVISQFFNLVNSILEKEGNKFNLESLKEILTLLNNTNNILLKPLSGVLNLISTLSIIVKDRSLIFFMFQALDSIVIELEEEKFDLRLRLASLNCLKNVMIYLFTYSSKFVSQKCSTVIKVILNLFKDENLQIEIKLASLDALSAILNIHIPKTLFQEILNTIRKVWNFFQNKTFQDNVQNSSLIFNQFNKSIIEIWTIIINLANKERKKKKNPSNFLLNIEELIFIKNFLKFLLNHLLTRVTIFSRMQKLLLDLLNEYGNYEKEFLEDQMIQKLKTISFHEEFK